MVGVGERLSNFLGGSRRWLVGGRGGGDAGAGALTRCCDHVGDQGRWCMIRAASSKGALVVAASDERLWPA